MKQYLRELYEIYEQAYKSNGLEAVHMVSQTIWFDNDVEFYIFMGKLRRDIAKLGGDA